MRIKKERFCVVCGDKIDPLSRRTKYCSNECEREKELRRKIKWYYDHEEAAKEYSRKYAKERADLIREYKKENAERIKLNNTLNQEKIGRQKFEWGVKNKDKYSSKDYRARKNVYFRKYRSKKKSLGISEDEQKDLREKYKIAAIKYYYKDHEYNKRARRIKTTIKSSEPKYKICYQCKEYFKYETEGKVFCARCLKIRRRLQRKIYFKRMLRKDYNSFKRLRRFYYYRRKNRFYL